MRSDTPTSTRPVTPLPASVTEREETHATTELGPSQKATARELTILGGLILIVLPTLIVGNELLIFGGVLAAVGAWFLAHRHGHLRGQLSGAAPKLGPGEFAVPIRHRTITR